MGLFLLIIFLSIILYVNSFLFKTMINPASIYTLIWLSVSCGAFLFEINLEYEQFKLSFVTIAVILFSVLFFSAGAWICVNLNNNIYISLPRISKESYYYYYLLLVISLILLPIALYKAYIMINTSLYESIFISLRSELTNEDGNSQNYGIATYGVTIANFNFLSYFNYYLKHKRNFVFLIVTFLIVVIFDILSTSRTAIFFTFIPSIFLYYTYKKPNIVSLLTSLLFMIFVFSVYTMLKSISELDSNFFDWEKLVESFRIYFLGGIYAINNKINSFNFIGNGNGSLLFRTLYAFMYSLGFDLKPENLIFLYEEVPIKTNVYTIFFPYLYDGGIIIALLFFFVIGYIHTYFYLRRYEANYSLIVYSLLMYPLFMSFFQDQYFFLMSIWIQYSILLVFQQIRFKI